MTHSQPDSLAPFSAMLREALGDLLAPDATTFLEMMAPDCVMEFPFTLPIWTRRVEGRPALAQYIEGLGHTLQIERMTLSRVLHTSEVGVVVLEFDGAGRALSGGGSYEQSYISVVTLRDGRIQHYRDYWNPLVALELSRGAGAGETPNAKEAS